MNKIVEERDNPGSDKDARNALLSHFWVQEHSEEGEEMAEVSSEEVRKTLKTFHQGRP